MHACRRGAGPRSLPPSSAFSHARPTPVPACSCCILQVVWALGVSPPPEVLTKASKLFERQAREDGANVLVVLLAAETQVWLDESEEETLRAVAAPFARLIDVYCTAVVRAVGEKAAYPAHDSDDEDEGEVHVDRGRRLPDASLSLTYMPSPLPLARSLTRCTWTAADASPAPRASSCSMPSRGQVRPSPFYCARARLSPTSPPLSF